MTGGVRKRGSTWSYYFDLGNVGGKRKKKEKGGFKKKSDAETALTKAMLQYTETGQVFTFSTMTVADYLDWWLENVIEKNIDNGYSYNTYISYESKVRLHFKPAFGIYRLNVFQNHSDLLQMWVDEMKKKAVSKASVKAMLACLSSAMEYAIKPMRYIKYNPCKDITVGKMEIDKFAVLHNEYICPVDEFEKILNRYPPTSNLHLSLVLPYHTGTRLGETFAIDLLHDVDFENCTLDINKQLMRVNKIWMFKPPKYESYRKIKIGKTLIDALKQEIIRRKKNMTSCGSDFLKTYVKPDNSIVQLPANISSEYREIMPLCTKRKGGILTPSSFCDVAGIVHHELGNVFFHSHCLRHTHGTILAENGVNPKTVMERLGHKDIVTTLKTYTFNTELMQNNAVDLFESATKSVKRIDD